MQPSMRGWKLQQALQWFGEVPDASCCTRTTLYGDTSFPKQTSSVALSGQFIKGCGKHNLFVFGFLVLLHCQDQSTLELDRNLGSWCCLGHSAYEAFSRTNIFETTEILAAWSLGRWARGQACHPNIKIYQNRNSRLLLMHWVREVIQITGTGIYKRSAAV